MDAKADRSPPLEQVRLASRLSGSSSSGVIIVSTLTYVLCWWVVLALHLVTAIFVLCSAFAHLILSTETAHNNTSALLIPIDLKRLSAASYFLVALAHFAALVNMLKHTLRGRRLVFRASSRQSTAPPSSLAPNRLQSFSTRIFDAWARLFGSHGYFGIHGRFFDVSLVFREMVEVLLQSYQLWTLSHSVSRAWINNLAVTTVVLNCWSIPIVSVLFNGNVPRRRLMCLVVDMYLDFVCAVVVPVLIMLPYMLDYDWTHGTFPVELLFSDTWYANAVAEGRQILVTTYVDFLSSLLPQYGIFSCLRLLKRLIRRTNSPSTIAPVDVSRSKSAVESVILIEPTPSGRSLRFVTACITVWGALVLGAHLHAAARGSTAISPGCILRLRPWLSTKEACSVKVINCHKLEVRGSTAEMTAILESLESTILTRIVFVRCSELEIPPIIRSFSQLSAVVTFHSYLMGWPLAAAITQTTNPSFTLTQFINTTMATMPLGITHRDLPHSMTGFGAAHCTILSIPQDLGDIWSSSALEHISFESVHIPGIPVSINKMRQLRKLWITSSTLTHLPEELFSGLRLESFRASGNPITRLPTMEDTSILNELYVEHSNLTAVPEWATAWLRARASSKAATMASFYGSPLCDGTAVPTTLCSIDARTSIGSFPIERTHATHPP